MSNYVPSFPQNGRARLFQRGTKQMKDFFQRYSYQSVRLFLNQIAIGLFGFVLALVAAKMGENVRLWAYLGIGGFSVLFFLFLQFASTWKVGAEDRVSVDLGKRKVNLWTPFFIWLLANSINFILAILIALAHAFGGGEATVNYVFGGMGGIAQVIKHIIEGMYTGLISIEVGGQALQQYWFVHFLTPLPALIVIYASYLSGLKNINFGGLFSSKHK
jgi:hypothetical protein